MARRTLFRTSQVGNFFWIKYVLWKVYFRGTYTSQHNAKRCNRKSEFLLRDCEILSVITKALDLQRRDSHCLSEYLNIKQEMDRLWKLVLLNRKLNLLARMRTHIFVLKKNFTMFCLVRQLNWCTRTRQNFTKMYCLLG